jgi:hypothetical protein
MPSPSPMFDRARDDRPPPPGSSPSAGRPGRSDPAARRSRPPGAAPGGPDGPRRPGAPSPSGRGGRPAARGAGPASEAGGPAMAFAAPPPTLRGTPGSHTPAWPGGPSPSFPADGAPHDRPSPGWPPAPSAAGTSLDDLSPSPDWPAPPGRPSERRRPGRPAPAAARARSVPTSPAALAPATGVDRLLAAPDVDGPRSLLGLAWAAGLVLSAIIGVPALLLLFGGVAVVAARGTALAWRQRGYDPDHRAAAVAAGVISVVAAIHISLAGLLLMVPLPVVAVLTAAAAPSPRLRPPPLVATAGAMLRAVVPPCIAVIGIMLVAQSGALALLAFFVLVSAYDAGHFLVAAESASPVPGILAGSLCTLVVGVPLVVSQLPPFNGGAVGLVFAGLVGAVAPLGQLVASLALPSASERVGALRRLDAYILTGPLFAFVLTRYLAVV